MAPARPDGGSRGAAQWPDGRGRALFATRALAPGERLLCEPPYLAADHCPSLETQAALAGLAAPPEGVDEDDWPLDGADGTLVALALYRATMAAADPPPDGPAPTEIWEDTEALWMRAVLPFSTVSSTLIHGDSLQTQNGMRRDGNICLV